MKGHVSRPGFMKLTYDEYTVGWVAVLLCEVNAARLLLDHEHDSLDTLPGDENNYILGDISGHNVIIAYPGVGRKGTSAAAYVATHMKRTFQNIAFGLLVGIAGGAPYAPDPEDARKDIRLGDVVVSCPVNGYGGGVRQVDYGKRLGLEDLKLTDHLNKPPKILLAGVETLKSDSRMHAFIRLASERSARLKMKGYSFPGWQNDQLFKASYPHCRSIEDEEFEQTCLKCDPNQLETRLHRDSEYPVVHHGIIASGNQVVRSAEYRDQLRKKYRFLCFEMEAAGLMDAFPCLVIRGICDYSDDHKNKMWQPYAAVTAAAYAKDLLRVVRPQKVTKQKSMAEVLQNLCGDIIMRSKKVEADIKESINNLLLEHRRLDHAQIRENILNWITPIDYNHQQHDAIRKREPGTCQWFLDSPEFQKWMKSDGQTLFCPGIPGAGKTVVASVVVDSLKARFRADETIGIAYVYCDFRRTHEQTAKDILASFLRQLVHGQSSLHDAHMAQGTLPSFEEISSTFRSVTALYSSVYIIIDAIDETSMACRYKLLPEILDLQHNVNLFVTSRHIPDIVRKFDGLTQLEIRANNKDVESYIESHLKSLPCFDDWSQKLREEVKSEISATVDGMFLLAHIYLDSLEDKITTKAVRRAIMQFRAPEPASSESTKCALLEGVYDQTIERINSQKAGFQEFAMRILSWITCARRPLHISELRHALAVDVGDSELDTENLASPERIISVCAGLVMIDKASSAIRFSHHTGQQYFEQTRAKWFPNAETDITKTCLTYLSFTVFERGPCATDEEFKKRLMQNPLFEYAARNWGHHARVSSAEVEDMALDFLKNESMVSNCSQAIASLTSRDSPGPSQDIPSKVTGLHLAAYFRLWKAVKVLISSGYDSEAKDSWNQAPLVMAASNGHDAVVKLLLDKGTNLETQDDKNYAPLSKALIHDKEAVVRLSMLDEGGDVKPSDNHVSTQPAGDSDARVEDDMTDGDYDSTGDHHVDSMQGDYSRVDSPRQRYASLEERKAILQQVKAQVKTMLDNDVPFFTKDAIRDVYQQIQQFTRQKKGEVLVRGLDGGMVRFDVEIGKVHWYWADRSNQRRIRYVTKKLSINYAAMQHLISDKWVEFLQPDLAYCNLKIYHDVDMLDEETGEIVSRTKPTGTSKEQVKQTFEKDLHEWLSSEQCRNLKSMSILRKDAHRIKKIVAFACGSIIKDDLRSRTRSSYQHGLIMTIREILSQARQDTVGDGGGGEQVQCFIQDPWYTDIEMELFLEDYGISTLEDPVGFLEVDDSTLVISIASNVPCKQIIADIAKPAVLIWNRVREEAEDRGWDLTDPDSSRVRNLIKGFYDQIDFPEDAEHFGDISIYRRRED